MLFIHNYLEKVLEREESVLGNLLGGRDERQRCGGICSPIAPPRGKQDWDRGQARDLCQPRSP